MPSIDRHHRLSGCRSGRALPTFGFSTRVSGNLLQVPAVGSDTPQKELGPPPTKLLQGPQRSRTVNGTVVCWPAVVRLTVKVAVWTPPSDTLPPEARVAPLTVTRALRRVPRVN